MVSMGQRVGCCLHCLAMDSWSFPAESWRGDVNQSLPLEIRNILGYFRAQIWGPGYILNRLKVQVSVG